MAAVTFKVERLQVVTRALQAAGGQIRRDGTNELAAIGGLVEHDAEFLAAANIRGTAKPTATGVAWAEMRTGVTPAVVYVVPAHKGTRGRGPRSRPNFAPLLLTRSMRPALERRRPDVMRRYSALVAKVCGSFNRG